VKHPVPPTEEILHWAALPGLAAERLRAPQKSHGLLFCLARTHSRKAESSSEISWSALCFQGEAGQTQEKICANAEGKEGLLCKAVRAMPGARTVLVCVNRQQRNAK